MVGDVKFSGKASGRSILEFRLQCPFRKARATRENWRRFPTGMPAHTRLGFEPLTATLVPMNFPLRLLPLLCLANAHAAPLAWEAPLPKGTHTDPVVLNKAAGETSAAALDMVKGAKGDLRPQDIPDLKPKVPHDGIFRVFFKRDGIALPPDMGGTGPFYVFKTGGSYYLLTKRNFATLFGPPKSKDEALPYVKVFDKLFINPMSDFILSATETKGFQKVAPPAVTEIKEAGDGWDVKAILFSPYRVMAFYEERLHVARDGMVEVKEKVKVIKEIGPGIMY